MNIENIGKNAGVVWRTLHGSENEMSFDALIESTKLDLMQVAAAVGWLARENKIVLKDTDKGIFLTVYKECYY